MKQGIITESKINHKLEERKKERKKERKRERKRERNILYFQQQRKNKIRKKKLTIKWNEND